MSMIEQIPDWLEQSLKEGGIAGNDILAAIASDLSLDGQVGEEWLVLTRQRILAFDVKDSGPLKRLDLALTALKSFRADSLIGGGALCAEFDDAAADVEDLAAERGILGVVSVEDDGVVEAVSVRGEGAVRDPSAVEIELGAAHDGSDLVGAENAGVH